MSPSPRLDRRYYYNSAHHPGPPEGFAGQWVDLARDPSDAHDLLKLDVSPRSDLPALLLSDAAGKLRVLALRLTPEEAARLTDGGGVGGDLVLYGASWCSDCRRAKLLLDDLGRSYDEINVDEDVEAEALVLARSGGRRVVPTLLFDGRVWAFNPEPALLEGLAGPASTAP